MTQNETRSDPAAGALPAEPNSERRVLVGVCISGVAIVFVTFVGIVWYYSWLRVGVVPSALFVVEGSKDSAGTAITVDGPALRTPRRDTIGPGASYICRFPLSPGEYTVRIERPGHLAKERILRISERGYALLPRAELEELPAERK